MIPYLPSRSPSIRSEVKIIKIGLSARNGNVNDRGDSFIAFMYNMSAVTSRGAKMSRVRKNGQSRLGISINGRSRSRKGMENPIRTQAIRYSPLFLSDRLQMASADVTKKAERRESRNQFTDTHRKKMKVMITKQ